MLCRSAESLPALLLSLSSSNWYKQVKFNTSCWHDCCWRSSCEMPQTLVCHCTPYFFTRWNSNCWCCFTYCFSFEFVLKVNYYNVILLSLLKFVSNLFAFMDCFEKSSSWDILFITSLLAKITSLRIVYGCY